MQGRQFPYEVNTTADHWWPKGLQRLWADGDGYISRIRPSSEVERRKPPRGARKGFAHTRGGHKMVFGVSPWNHTFEPDFNTIDNIGPPILRRLTKQLLGEDQGLFRKSEIEITIDTVIKLCFSLMIRSPAFRHRYAHAGKSFGFVYNEKTGTANISHFWRAVKSINLINCNSVKLVFLFSADPEFFFGDGLYDTIFTRSVGWRPRGMGWVADLTGDALVPLLPNLCAYLNFSRGGTGMHSYILPVNYDTVTEVNFLTQVYSKKELFFCGKIPALTEEYKRGEHMCESSGKPSLILSLQKQFL